MNADPPPGVGKSESKRAFEDFVAERYAKVFAAVKMITNNAAAAEDITQESFAKAWINWPKVWPDGNPVGWVHRVAANSAISFRRRLTREIKVKARLQRRETFSVESPDFHPELLQAVTKLPRRQRAAVGFYYGAGMSVEETAHAMGCAQGTIKSLLFGARATLRKALGEDYM